MSLLDEWTRQNEALASKLEGLDAMAEVVLKLVQNEEWSQPRE